MRKNVILFGAMLMMASSAMAQSSQGGIRNATLQQIVKAQNGSANKALFKDRKSVV